MRANIATLQSLYDYRGKRKYLTAEERTRFLKAADACPRPELRTLCLTLAWTGCRISEALNLTASSIERETGFIAIRTLKKRRNIVFIREVPVPPDLLATIELVHFASQKPPDARLWKLSRCRAWQLIKAVMDLALIAPGIHATPRGLRHSYGIHAVSRGIPLNLVQRWLGHARMTTTALYLQAMGSEEKQIARRMWNDET